MNLLWLNGVGGYHEIIRNRFANTFDFGYISRCNCEEANAAGRAMGVAISSIQGAARSCSPGQYEHKYPGLYWL